METTKLLSKFAILNAEAQQEVLDFLEFLTQKQQKAQIKSLLPTQDPLVFGELAGNFRVSEDFNAPLEK